MINPELHIRGTPTSPNLVLSPFHSHNIEADKTPTILLHHDLPTDLYVNPINQTKLKANKYLVALHSFPRYMMNISTLPSILQGAKRTKSATQQFSNRLLVTQDFCRSKATQNPAQPQNPASKIQRKGSAKKLYFPLKSHPRRKKKKKKKVEL